MSDDPPTRSETTLWQALLAVQAQAPTLVKDARADVRSDTGKSYSYHYTKLDTIVEKVGPLLQSYGLVWSAQPTGSREEPRLHYMLMHAPSSQYLEGEMPLMLERQTAQGLGSAITYARRYALCAVLNLVADEDDDGEAAGTQTRSERSENGGVNLQQQAKGLRDDAINAALVQAGLAQVEKPWGALRSVPTEYAERVRAALEAMRAAT